MKKEIYYNNLFDYYGELLNEKQQEYFKYYYFDNLYLNLSRNAIHKQLKLIEEKLEFYDNKLKLIDKDKKLIDFSNKINDKNLKEELLSIIEL